MSTQEKSDLKILIEALVEANRLFAYQSKDPDEVMKHHAKAEQHLGEVRKWLEDYGNLNLVEQSE